MSADDTGLDLVTGAFGNTGSAIRALLESSGRRVRTLTDHPPADPGAVELHPYAWDDHAAMASAFEGVRTFYNTFWMRTGDASGYATAVARSRALLAAARAAGVPKVVQLSVAHPALDSPYPYFRGKAEVEAIAADAAPSTTVVRPALIFGGNAPLLENLAWMLRRLPVFGLAGDGRYLVRPVHVDDVASICVEGSTRSTPFEAIDAVGPERIPYGDFVRAVRSAVHGYARVVRMPVPLVLGSARLLGWLLRDELVTRDELVSTIAGLADTDGLPTGRIAFTEWLEQNGASLGRRYRNERRNRR